MNPLYVLLLAIPVSIYLHLAHHPIALFFAACLAIVPLAGIMGEATENLACYTGEKTGGFLNATFGNATELLITVFALKAGLFDVVKASVAGSILGNILLVLGLSILVGGLKNGQQTFSRLHITSHTSQMFLAVIALVIPAVFYHGGLHHGTIAGFSFIVAIVLFVLYIAGVVFTMRSGSRETEAHAAEWTKTKSLLLLALSTVFIAMESEFLVSGIEPVTASLGWSSFFIGIIVIPIIGNAAEHFTAIVMARKNKMDLALEIAVGSSAQIAMLVTPVLVFVSFILGNPMSIVFNYYEIVAVTFAVMIAQFISLDGESTWLEGAQLIAAYLIMAIGFFFV